MNSIYPMEEKPIAPPSYEQAIYPPPGGMYPQQGQIFQQSPVPSMGMYPQASNSPYQAPPMGTHVLITTQSMMYGDVPIQCTCPHCHQAIVTRLEKRTGVVPWLVCGGILFLGGWLGCCLIPFCIDGLKDTEHYCPHCAVLLGTRRRM